MPCLTLNVYTNPVRTKFTSMLVLQSVQILLRCRTIHWLINSSMIKSCLVMESFLVLPNLFSNIFVWLHNIVHDLHTKSSLCIHVIHVSGMAHGTWHTCQWLLAHYYGQPSSMLGLSNFDLGMYLDGWLYGRVNFCW